LRLDLRSPLILWRTHDGECEIVVELRHATPLVCAVVVLIIHLAGATSVTAALLVAALSIVAAGVVWVWQMAKHVRAARRLEAHWVQVGDMMEERFTMWNGSFLPVSWAEVTDHSNVPGYNAGTVRSVDGNSELQWTYSGSATRRGEFHMGPWSVETGDPWGIFAVRINHPQARPLLVYPPLADLPFPPLPRGASLGVSRTNLAALRPTTNAGQVRAYELGDSFRHIHWPSTAHRDELMVKMFDQEASADVWLLVDTDPTVQSGNGDTATEEVGVIVAASLANDLLREGRAVGLITYTPERNIVWPARSTGQLWNLLGQLARLPSADERPDSASGDSEREGFGLRQVWPHLVHVLRERIAQRWENIRLVRRQRETPDTAKLTVEDYHGQRGMPLVRVLKQISHLLRAGSNVVVITPSSDLTWVSGLAQLAWQQITPTVILLDGSPVMTALLAERGIVCRTVRCDVPLPVRPAMGKTRHWEFKTLTTGRVVKVMESVR
jgi:uncharacterized protein (DUF58 family)